MVKLKWSKRDGELVTQNFLVTDKILTHLTKRGFIRSRAMYHSLSDQTTYAHFRIVKFSHGINLRMYDNRDSVMVVVRPPKEDLYSSNASAKQAAQRLVK